MGNRILGTNIAGILNRALGPILLSGTLGSFTSGARSAGALGSGPTITYTNHSFRGVADETRRERIPPDVQQRSNRVLLILGDSLPAGVVPKVNDRITLEGTTGTVIWVDRDPDAASYTAAVGD